MDSPSDQVTRRKMAYVLYMDIVGFSLLKVDQQRQRIRELTVLVRGTEEYQRARPGEDLISLPTGDGMALTFLNEPEAPVHCALEIAESLRDLPDIPLRMGIHYGSVYVDEDINGNQNVTGNGINLAQRLMDCGDAGHILLSSVVADELSQSSEWEPCIADLGECEVKHKQRLRVFNLVREGLGNPTRPAKLSSVAPETEQAAQTPALPSQVIPRTSEPPSQTEVPEPPRTRDGAEKVYIPAGAFWMGDDDLSDNPRREVYVNSYWIYKTPVTVKQYMAFCDATGHGKPKEPSLGWQDDHPIVNVSWEDAQDYCKWAGAELPTEAQWEKAARGTDGRKYPWIGEWDGSKCANSVGSNSLKGTVAVGSYPQGASPFGVLDMAGNVWEWCQDYYDTKFHDSREAKQPNPVNNAPVAHGSRVLRGGSWYNFSEYFFRCAYRNGSIPGGRYIYGGFRCCAPGL